MRRCLALAWLFALPGPAWADIKTGVEAWERGDYAAAVAAWQQPADAGDADAQFNLGQAYKLGRGVPADLAIAAEWYRKAAAQGHQQAETNLGIVLWQTGGRDEAVPLLKKAAARGDARAQFVLATALFNGDHIERDAVKAYALMTRAIEAGIPQADASRAQMDAFLDPVQRTDALALAGRLAIEPQLVLVDRGHAAAPAASAINAAPSRPVPPPAPTPKPPPARSVATAPVRAMPVPQTGGWRVQLGAFGSEANARALWTSLTAMLPQLAQRTPVYARAGAIVRLQAAGFASRSDADAVCRSIAQTGNACFVVKG